MKSKRATFSILAFLFAVVLISCYSVLTVHATGTAEITFGHVSSKRGEQIIVPVTIKNNPGIASFRFRVAYAADALTYVSATKGEAMTGGTLSAEYQTEDEKLAITWFDVKNIVGDGVIFNLIFNVSEIAEGKYPLTITYPPEDIVNDSWQQVDVIVVDGWVQIGNNISGSITSFDASDDEVTIKLMQNGTEVAGTTTTDGTYIFTSVAPGNYSLVISKQNHITRTYEISVIGEDIIQNGIIYLIGDINEDGQLNNADAIYLLYNVIFGDGTYPVNQNCDFNNDGSVTNADAIYLLYHVIFGDLYPLR